MNEGDLNSILRHFRKQVPEEPGPWFLVGRHPVSWTRRFLLAGIGIAAFHLAFCFERLSFLVVIYLWSLFELRHLPTSRQAFYTGLAVGVACFGPQLLFFWRIFSVGAVGLWLVLAFWIGLFALLSRHCADRFGAKNAALLAPWIWLGLDYFRGELYYLRFSWFSPGYAFTHVPNAPAVFWVGAYGVGWVLMATVAMGSMLSYKRSRWFAWGVTAVLAAVSNSPRISIGASEGIGQVLRVAGIQLEFPGPPEVLMALDSVVKASPEAQLIVLSEYTFDGPVPELVKRWCKDHGKYLMAGGKEPAGENYFNTAFVVSPNGEVCFKQAKCVPIQFFKDGLPANTQRLWESPWGRIGVCICYDMSYRRVVDRLVQLGAAAIVSPMMDVVDWGARQHTLHSWVPPVRAAEFGVPIFRVASSGISQIVESSGRVLAKAGFPGPGQVITGELKLGRAGRLPVDHWLGPLGVSITTAVMLSFFYPLKRRQKMGGRC